MAPTVRREEIHVLSVLSDLYCLSNGVLLASSRIVRTGEDQVKQVPHTKDISWAEKGKKIERIIFLTTIINYILLFIFF